jgi:hypothetical protein
MPSCTSTLLRADPAKPTPVFPRLFRAHVHAAANSRAPERTCFIEAAGHSDAVAKIAATVAALERRSPAEVADRIYNCFSAQELIDSGVSEDIPLRLFETGWAGNRATHFVEQPLFLVARPGELARIWARCPARSDGDPLTAIEHARALAEEAQHRVCAVVGSLGEKDYELADQLADAAHDLAMAIDALTPAGRAAHGPCAVAEFVRQRSAKEGAR